MTKNALITGAAKRVGLEIAKALKSEGWNVIIHHNSTPVKGFLGVKADLNNFSEVVQVIAQAREKFGEISLLINNASIFKRVNFFDTDEKLFDENFNIQVKAAFFLAQEFAKQCSNGQIINMIDILTAKSRKQYFAYALSKLSLANLTKMLAEELAPNIRVNSIFPKPIAEFTEDKLPDLIPVSAVTSAVIDLAKSDLTGQEIFL